MSEEHVLHVSIVTPARIAFEGSALAVTVPGSKSPFQVLYNHAPIISSLDIGTLKLVFPNNDVAFYAVKEGFVEVLKNNVNIVVQEILSAAEINTEEMSQEVESARQRWNASHGRGARDDALRDLHWAEARYRVATLHQTASAR
jgi:F-type H+-transporting ATPase subunit epsilon